MESLQTIQTKEKQEEKRKEQVMFRIYAPSSTTPMLLSEDLDLTVGQIVKKAQEHFGFEGTYVLQDDNDKVLMNDESLKKAGVKCGEDLFLTRNGGGVATPALDNVEKEIDAVIFFAEKRGVRSVLEAREKKIKMTLTRRSDGEVFYVVFDYGDYRKFPPKIYFTDATFTRTKHKPDFPMGGNTSFGSSIFHGAPAICAPFNQLAYGEHAGPHGNWHLSQWESQGAANEVKAKTLADMLSIILRDLQQSQGRMV